MTNITNHTSGTSKIKSTKIEQSSNEMIKQLNLSLLVATQSKCGLPTQILVTTKEIVTKQTYNSKQILIHTYNTHPHSSSNPHSTAIQIPYSNQKTYLNPSTKAHTYHPRSTGTTPPPILMYNLLKSKFCMSPPPGLSTFH